MMSPTDKPASADRRHDREQVRPNIQDFTDVAPSRDTLSPAQTGASLANGWRDALSRLCSGFVQQFPGPDSSPCPAERVEKVQIQHVWRELLDLLLPIYGWPRSIQMAGIDRLSSVADPNSTLERNRNIVIRLDDVSGRLGRRRQAIAAVDRPDRAKPDHAAFRVAPGSQNFRLGLQAPRSFVSCACRNSKASGPVTLMVESYAY